VFLYASTACGVRVDAADLLGGLRHHVVHFPCAIDVVTDRELRRAWARQRDACVVGDVSPSPNCEPHTNAILADRDLEGWPQVPEVTGGVLADECLAVLKRTNIGHKSET
jgi:hypothetical protein